MTLIARVSIVHDKNHKMMHILQNGVPIMRLTKALLISLFLLIPIKASAQTVETALSLLGDSVIDSIDDSVNNLFDRVDSTIVGMRSNAEGLIASATSDMSDFLNQTVDELEDQERAVWLYYSNALKKLDRRVENYSRTARITVLDTTNAAGEVIPFSSNDPNIYWVEVSPPLFDHEAESWRVTAFGTNLGRDYNSLLANDTQARRVTTSPTELSFEVDNIDITDGLKLAYVLNGKRSFFHHLGSWTDRENDPKIFKIPGQADYVGMTRLIYQQDSYPVITRRWPTNGSFHSVNCQRGGTFGTSGCRANFGPTFISAQSGYSVLVDTVKQESNSHGCRGTETRVEIRDRSSNGFRVFGTGYPNSGAGRRCRLNARFIWQERQNVPVEEEKITEEQALRRSLNGVTFRYPAQGAEPIGISVLHDGETEPQIYDLDSIRADFSINAQPGTGIVEVTWGND